MLPGSQGSQSPENLMMPPIHWSGAHSVFPCCAFVYGKHLLHSVLSFEITSLSPVHRRPVEVVAGSSQVLIIGPGTVASGQLSHSPSSFIL